MPKHCKVSSLPTPTPTSRRSMYAHHLRHETPPSPTARTSDFFDHDKVVSLSNGIKHELGDEQNEKGPNSALPRHLVSQDIINRDPSMSWARQPEGPYLKAALVYLRRAYDISWSDMSKIFWEMFPFVLIDHGLNPGQSLERKLSSQFHEVLRQRGSKYSICIAMPFEELHSASVCADLNMRLIHAASNVGVPLRRRTSDILSESNHGERRRQLKLELFPEFPPSFRFNLCEDDESDAATSSSVDDDPALTIRIASNRMETAPSPLLRTSFHPSSLTELVDREVIPFLLWRAWDLKSHGVNSPSLFRAARFNYPGIIIPTAPHHLNTTLLDSTFLDDVEQHLYSNTFDGPFVSVTSSFIWAFHKALMKSRQSPRTEAYVSCISAHAAADKTEIFYSKLQVERLRQQGRARSIRYKANYEWLIWGEVGATSIISAMPISQIRTLAAQNSEVADFLQLSVLDTNKSMKTIMSSLVKPSANGTTGKAVGKLVRAILEGGQSGNFTRSNPFVNELILGFLQNWRVNVDLRHWRLELDLVKGIDSGLLPNDSLSHSSRQTTSPVTLSPLNDIHQQQPEHGLPSPLSTPPRPIRSAATADSNSSQERSRYPRIGYNAQMVDKDANEVHLMSEEDSDVASTFVNDDDDDETILDEDFVADEENSDDSIVGDDSDDASVLYYDDGMSYIDDEEVKEDIECETPGSEESAPSTDEDDEFIMIDSDGETEFEGFEDENPGGSEEILSSQGTNSHGMVLFSPYQ